MSLQFSYQEIYAPFIYMPLDTCIFNMYICIFLYPNLHEEAFTWDIHKSHTWKHMTEWSIELPCSPFFFLSWWRVLLLLCCVCLSILFCFFVFETEYSGYLDVWCLIPCTILFSFGLIRMGCLDLHDWWNGNCLLSVQGLIDLKCLLFLWIQLKTFGFCFNFWLKFPFRWWYTNTSRFDLVSQFVLL